MIAAGFSMRCVSACTFLFASHLFAAAPAGTLSFDEPAAFEIQGSNRTLTNENGSLYLNASKDDGVAWVKGIEFTNGRISVEVKGADRMGESFVGLAFHANKERQTGDVVYVRPFNFRPADPQRRARALQYMAVPNYPWDVLREKFPGKYEAAIEPAPKPDDWVRMSIDVQDGKARVFINDQSESTMQVELLNKDGGTAIALWVGNNSDGSFRNLRILQAD